MLGRRNRKPKLREPSSGLSFPEEDVPNWKAALALVIGFSVGAYVFVFLSFWGMGHFERCNEVGGNFNYFQMKCEKVVKPIVKLPYEECTGKGCPGPVGLTGRTS